MYSIDVSLTVSVPSSVVDFCMIHNLSISKYCAFLLSLNNRENLLDKHLVVESFLHSSSNSNFLKFLINECEV